MQRRLAELGVVLGTKVGQFVLFPVGPQQKMMRHASITITKDVYGDVVTDEMSAASLKVTELAFRANGAQAERKSS